MKNTIYSISLMFFAGIIMFSCEEWIDPEINLSPNAPTEVTLDLLLPSTQGALFYSFGGDHSRAPSIWMQHQAGIDRQALAFDRFIYLESDVNNLWNTLNANALKNLYEMREQSAETGSPHYEAVSNLLTALALGKKTDIWGDVPFYEAHRAETGTLTPAYQSQETIYNVIDSLINVSIDQIDEAESLFSPSAGADLIYEGDLDSWKRFAWTLKLRYKLHLSEINGYDDALAILNDDDAEFMEGNNDDFQFQFGTAGDARSPRYNFNESRGDIRAGAYLVDLMLDNNDPRIPVYFEPIEKDDADDPDEYVGSGPAAATITASWMGDFYGADNAFVPVLTYVEFKFMEAEILYNTGGEAGAAEAYNDAVKASLERHNVIDAVWEADHANETAATISMETIMMGKYVALYLQAEVWVDYRRTGYPNDLPLPADNAMNEIPRRVPYPLNERLYNEENMPKGLTMSDRLWWDVE